MQSDWQVNARALVGLAMTIKTIPRIVSIAKRIPALLYVAKVFIVILSKHDVTVRKASTEESCLLWNKAECLISGFRFGAAVSL
jgi:hypothetical protein